METFELHQITSLPNFRELKSSKRTGTYSTCILGVLLRCQRHDELVASGKGPIGGVIDMGLVNLFTFWDLS